LEDAEAAIPAATQEGAKIFVTTVNNACYLKAKLDVPIVEIPFDAFDAVYALNKAKTRYGNPIAFFQYLYHNPYLPAFREITDCAITEFVFHDECEGLSLLRRARKEGYRAIVGGGLIFSMAQKKLGYRQAILLVPKKESILQSYETARQILIAQRNEQRKSLVFKCIVEHSFEGIIAIDDGKKITVFNPAAEKILGIPQQAVLGHHVRDVLPENLLPPVIELGEAQLDHMKTLGQKQLIINGMPIYGDRKIIEAIFTLQEVQRIESLEEKVRRTARGDDFTARKTFQDIVGVSRVMLATLDYARRFAAVKETVLISGETGTGKEIFAQSMHNASACQRHPFVGVNCAAIQPSLLESELFGYAEGSFTGAKQGGRKGLFELAHGGTIFLDEIGELTQDAQLRLLRVLQEKQVRRVGDVKVIPIDVRVIAATNQRLEEAVQQGRFRSDLYYRLNILQLRIPPLRERPEDILPLARFFLRQFCKNTELGTLIQSVLGRRHRLLVSYSWAGNIRELENLIKRIVVLAETKLDGSAETLIEDILNEALSVMPANSQIPEPDPAGSLKDALESTELQLITRLYEQANFSKSALARNLGMGRTTLWRKMNKLGINQKAFR